MIFTDTHIHLYADDFLTDRDVLIKEAIDAGIQRFFLPNIDTTSINAMMEVQERYFQYCFPMMGLHPCSVKENWKEEMNTVERQLKGNKIYGVWKDRTGSYLYRTF